MSPLPRLVAPLLLLVTAPAPFRAQQVDTVRAGSGLVRPELLTPGTYALDNYRVDGPQRVLASRTTQSVEAGPETFVIRTSHATRSDTSYSVTVVRRSDLAMVHHQVRAPRDSTDVTANGEYLTGWTALPGTPPQLIGLRLTHPVFPVEGQIPWLIGLLPLRQGFRAAVPHFSEWDRREEWGHLEVQASEPVRIGDLTFDCWKVDAGALGPPGYRATAWIDKATGRLVQGALRGPAGQTEYWSWVVTP
jgi:hypothetical protein